MRPEPLDLHICEQGSSSSFVKTDSENKQPSSRAAKKNQQILNITIEVTPEGKKDNLNKAQPTVKVKDNLIPNFDQQNLKSKPKRMGSEKPGDNSPSKLRKVPCIKNSLSLRSNKKKMKKKTQRSKVSESEYDFSSNKDYAEEQGRKAFNFAPSSN